MSTTPDLFKQRLEEVQQERQAEAVSMTFEGFPCEVLPIPYGLFITSGRMPDYLTNIVLEENPQKAQSIAAKMTTEEIREGDRFMCHVVCKALVSPRVIPEGVPAEGEYLYADLLETAPKFVGSVWRWIMRGCPMPKEEKGEGVLGVEDLESFPESAGGQPGTQSRDKGKGGGKTTRGTAAANRKRTRRK